MAALGGVVARNPAVAGGSTAFLVALFYVSANAIWYQPGVHRTPFFPTRDYVRPLDAPTSDEPETTFLIERPQQPAASEPPARDTTIEQVQRSLKELGFYAGALDGLMGPATAKAIQDYRTKVGLMPVGTVDDELLVQLGLMPTAGITPVPSPRQAGDAANEEQIALTRKIQAGLKAFGQDKIEVDGILGSRTRAAIREFESIFGLPVTGEPNAALHAKMREIGLTN